MNKLRLLLAVLALAGAACASTASSHSDRARWEQHARAVTIARDDWGIPHVQGKTDADAVFGLIYAQAEDDFHRIEVNYLNALGRLAEAEGEGEVYRDLRMKLFIDPADLEAKYRTSPAWLRKLMDAWADGLNYFLARYPEVQPQVLRRFEPWMALAFSEGSIGGDIETISLDGLAEFYGKGPVPPPLPPAASSTEPAAATEPGGSNGFAIAPAKTTNGAALLLINPHTSFFFRAEVQVASEEGLNAYGAVTWGQFFVYQGFNEHAGWMHTSSGVDAIDEYAETVFEQDGKLFYRHAGGARPLTSQRIVVPYKTAQGRAEKELTVYRTHHGPIVRAADGKWISVRLMQEPVKALMQSYGRTKAPGYAAFKEIMELHTNSSNNTVFADAAGNIAYFHANFVPRRDPHWSRPVDGSDPATEWGELYEVDESPGLLNPPSGWIQNTNNAPYSAAGPHSPREQDYPSYMDRAGQNPRGVHALQVLESGTRFTLDSLIAAAYDPALPAFDDALPRLFQDYDALPAGDPLRAKLAEPIAALRRWDRGWAVESIPTSVAVYWGEALWKAAEAAGQKGKEYDFLRSGATAAERLGALAAFGAQSYKGSRKIYGTKGNSFVAVVEFGQTLRAKAVTAGGQSGDPRSPHFNDQALRYTQGALRDVYFYPRDLEGHVERVYHPGE
jgi:acyl-homoserine-lactone acylase